MTAELIAILKALEIRGEKGDKDIIIWTDSQSALQAIENNNINVYDNEYVIKIRKKIEELEKRLKETKVVIAWVPAHMGVKGNEKADRIAKQGTKEEKDSEVRIPFRDVKQEYREEMKKKTQRRIEEEGLLKK